MLLFHLSLWVIVGCLIKSRGRTYIGIQFFRLSSVLYGYVCILFFFSFSSYNVYNFYLFCFLDISCRYNVYLAELTCFHTSIAYLIKESQHQFLAPLEVLVCCIPASILTSTENLPEARCLALIIPSKGLGKNLTRAPVFWAIVSGCSWLVYLLTDIWHRISKQSFY